MQGQDRDLSFRVSDVCYGGIGNPLRSDHQPLRTRVCRVSNERFRHDRSDGVEQAPLSAALADRRAHIFTAQATPRRAEDDDPILRAAASVVDPCVCAHSDGVPDGAERLVRPDDRADGVLAFDRQSAVFGAV